MHRVLQSLYIGDYASSVDTDALFANRITHILTAAAHTPARFPKMFQYLLLDDVLDMDNFCINKHFVKSNKFIETGRKSGAVLVHCQEGMSRSATIVCAYLIFKMKVSLTDALDLVREVHPTACPNDGFMQQLAAYHDKVCGVPQVIQEPPAAKVVAPAAVPAATEDTPRPQASQESAAPATAQPPTQTQAPEVLEPTSVPTAVSQPTTMTPTTSSPPAASLPAAPQNDIACYLCRSCRMLLFTEEDILPHMKNQAKNQTVYTVFKHKRRIDGGPTEDCTSLFINQQDWMKELGENQGKLLCPRCGQRVGSWKWDGMQCSCSAWQTPAFQIAKCRVDAREPRV
eukprot:TRINITY_DN3065_c0_g1_i3.p1 TRINITY_DN3065_c0_g1~~TRINITY_DN3065_c0_g1_i3.p1  ORF type:complete len:351 (+),score=80.10 TRINITY_DN3065_c0_g1_i3:26-1054(+)